MNFFVDLAELRRSVVNLWGRLREHYLSRNIARPWGHHSVLQYFSHFLLQTLGKGDTARLDAYETSIFKIPVIFE